MLEYYFYCCLKRATMSNQWRKKLPSENMPAELANWEAAPVANL